MDVVNCKDCHNENCKNRGVNLRTTCWAYKTHPRPQTKGDRIRSMTNEKLAEYFTQFYYDGPKFYCPAVADVGEGACAANHDCHQCLLDWLRQGVEEGE